MFLLPRRAAQPAPHSDFWYSPLTVGGASGAPATPDQALHIGAVYNCVRVLSETLAQTPLILYRRLDGGGKERAREHPLYPLLHTKPNSHQTSFEWREMLQGHLCLRGNGYAHHVYRGSQIVGLVPMHPDRTKVEWLPDAQRMRYRYKPVGSEQEKTYTQDEVLHLRGLQSDGYMGLNPIEVCARTLGYAQTTERFGQKFFDNDATPGGWIEHPSHFKDREAKQQFRQDWIEMQSGANRGKTAVLEYGMKYHDVGMKMTDAQFLETRRANKQDVAAMFRVQPHKIGILADAKWANIEAQNIEFVTDTMMPWFVRWEQRLSESLLTEAEQDEYFFEFLVTGLLRGDSDARAKYYKAGINDGWLLRNEAREAENLNPIDGLSEPLQPLNMTEAGTQPSEPEPAGDEGNNARLQAVELAAAQAIVNKEVQQIRTLHRKSDAIEADFEAWHQATLRDAICRVLATDPVKAQQYCDYSTRALSDVLAADAVDLEAAMKHWASEHPALLLELIHA